MCRPLASMDEPQRQAARAEGVPCLKPSLQRRGEATGNDKVVLTERGSSFGYNNLVVDMRGLKTMRDAGWPVVFDATHSVQLPGGAGAASAGQPEFIEPLARAAVAAGVDGVFVEVHDRPEEALSDGANALRLGLLEGFWRRLRAVHELVSGFGG